MAENKMVLKFKDAFTILTIICGFMVIVFSSVSDFFIASLFIIIGWIFDVMDGFYCRLTKTANDFGAEFDRIADLIIYSMAPGVLAFFVYKQYNIHLAAFIGVVPLVFGSIRLARFNIKRVEYPGYWFGLPRPASALAIVSFLNSSMFFKLEFKEAGLIFILIVCLMNLSTIPYIGHHNRKFSKTQKGLMILTLVGFIASAYFKKGWDYIAVLSIAYIVSPLFLPEKKKTELRKFLADINK